MKNFELGSKEVSRRWLLASAGMGVAALGLSACGANPDDRTVKSANPGGGSPGELVVFDGGGALGQAQRTAYFEPFEKETGIKVVPAPGPTAAQLRTAINAGKPGLDVIDLAGPRIPTWTKEGLVQKIDYSVWKNPGMREDFDPYPALDTGVPSIIYATQLAYDKKITGKDLTSWSDLWDTSIPGKRSLRTGDSAAGATYEIALLADGVKPEDLYPLDLDRAFRKLDEIKPNVLKFWDSGAESVQMVVDRQISAVAAWNGRVETAVSGGADISSTFNQAIVGLDYWAIPKGAANVEAASRFIEFATLPEQQAKFAALIAYSPTIPSAFDHIAEDRKKLLVTAPGTVEKTVLQDNEYWSSTSNGKPMDELAAERWQKWLVAG